MESRHVLVQVYFENLQATRGLTPEVARDLGYCPTPEAFEADISSGAELPTSELPVVIADPGLNADWHAEQAQKRRSSWRRI